MRRLYHEIVWRVLWHTCCRWLYQGPKPLRWLSWAVLPTVGKHGYRVEDADA